jgi:hypothetical protein
MNIFEGQIFSSVPNRLSFEGQIFSSVPNRLSHVHHLTHSAHPVPLDV